MYKVYYAACLFSPLLLSISFASAGNNQSKPGSTVHIGYVGFNGVLCGPRASVEGDLGAVFYVADSVDLARSFAYGTDADKAHICMVHVSRAAWDVAPKIWVAPSIFDSGGHAVDSAYPGSEVRFAPHPPFGLPKEAPSVVFQLGIKGDQIRGLDTEMECFPKSQFTGRHETINYGSMTRKWKIKQDRRQWVQEWYY